MDYYFIFFFLRIFLIYFFSLLLESLFCIKLSIDKEDCYDGEDENIYYVDEDEDMYFVAEDKDRYYLDLYELKNDPLEPYLSLEEFINDSNFLFEYGEFFVVLYLLRSLFFFTFFLYSFQFFIVKFFMYLSIGDFFYKFKLFFNFLKIQFKKCFEKCYKFYKYPPSFSLVSFFQLFDWSYNNYPIKTFLIMFYIISCLTFKYMHYFEVGFHFYEFFDSLLYFFVNFIIVNILLFFFFIFMLNFYGFCIWFLTLNRVYHYVLFFSFFYILCAYPFYFFFDLLGISLIDI